MISTVWLDVRTTSTVDKVLADVQDHNQDCLKSLCGLPVSTYFSAVKIRWLMDNVPAVRSAMEEKHCYFGTADTWLLWVRCVLSKAVSGAVQLVGLPVCSLSSTDVRPALNRACDWNTCVRLKLWFPKPCWIILICTKSDEHSLFLSLIHCQIRHASRTQFHINAHKNWLRHPTYVKLGKQTRYTWLYYHLSVLGANTTAVQIAAPVRKILDPPTYSASCSW